MSGLGKKKIIKISAGGFHTLALCEDNELYSWGNGVHGECGYGEFLESNVPRVVKMPKDGGYFGEIHDHDEDGFKIKQISAGGHHSLVLTQAGHVYSFGYGSHG